MESMTVSRRNDSITSIQGIVRTNRASRRTESTRVKRGRPFFLQARGPRRADDRDFCHSDIPRRRRVSDRRKLPWLPALRFRCEAASENASRHREDDRECRFACARWWSEAYSERRGPCVEASRADAAIMSNGPLFRKGDRIARGIAAGPRHAGAAFEANS
jgi:hypothetical protein